GTADPQVPLSVLRAKNGSGNFGYRTSDNEGAELGWGGIAGRVGWDRNFGSCSIYALGDIVSNNVMVSTKQSTYSDIRIKKDIHPSSSANDLGTLSKIEIVDYKM